VARSRRNRTSVTPITQRFEGVARETTRVQLRSKGYLSKLFFVRSWYERTPFFPVVLMNLAFLCCCTLVYTSVFHIYVEWNP